MHVPSPNRVDTADAVSMIRSAAFGHLVSMTARGLESTGLPVTVHESGDGIVLRAHFARANPHLKSLDGADALMIFPLADGYVSPAWYPTKADDPKVVPTWNYEVVHAHGVVAVHDDPSWTRTMVGDLTRRHESERLDLEDAPEWAVTDAPADFVDRQLRAIVGVEMVVDRVEAKRKLSQNKSDTDHDGVVEGLAGQMGHRADRLAAAMSENAAAGRPPSDALRRALAQIDEQFDQRRSPGP